MSKKPKEKPPTSRFGRLARLAGLSTKGIPLALEGARRALGKKKPRTEEEELAAKKKLTADTKKAAEAMLKTLGDMKGLPLKIGQMMSYIDGIAPPGYEEKFQRTLKKLQDKAPPLSPEAAVKMVTSELGEPPDAVFADWEYEPFAAASIGQVHARHHQGQREGGGEGAVSRHRQGHSSNDLKSVGLFRQHDGAAGQSHARQANHRRAHRGVPQTSSTTPARRRWPTSSGASTTNDDDILVPRIVQSLSSTRRVLTAELIGGIGYTPSSCETRVTRGARDRAGLTIWRFMFKLAAQATATCMPIPTPATTASSKTAASPFSTSAV